MPEEIHTPSQRYMEKGCGRQVLVGKVTIEPTTEDEPRRSEFIDLVLSRLRKTG